MSDQPIYIFSPESFGKSQKKIGKTPRVVYYLGRQFNRFLDIEMAGGHRNVRPLGPLFHEIYDEIHEEFAVYSAQFAKTDPHPNFWATATASRHSSSAQIREIVYLVAALRLCESLESDLGFICESPALGSCLEDALSQGGRRWIRVGGSRRWAAFRPIAMAILRRVLRFSIEFWERWWALRFSGNLRIRPDAGPISLVRSFYTRGAITDGHYRDRNFGELIPHLEAEGRDLWVAPLFFNIEKPFAKNLLQMNTASFRKFVFAEHYVPLWAFLSVIWSLGRTLGIKFPRDHRFRGMDISAVLRGCHLACAMVPEDLHNFLFGKALDRLARQGVQLQQLIYPFENNPVEKILIQKTRENFPGAQIVGFQHTVWLKENSCMELCEEELESHPLPDLIVTSGDAYPKIMADQGFPHRLIKTGPSLRFDHLRSLEPEETTDSMSEVLGRVLVILTYDEQMSFEVLYKISKPLWKLGLKAWIKPHPLMPRSRIEPMLERLEFSDHRFVSGPITELAPQVGAVMMQGGSICNFEVMACGIPLVRISFGGDFDFDPVWDDYPWGAFVHASQDIEEALVKALDARLNHSQDVRQYGKTIIEKYFGEVDPKAMKVFNQAVGTTQPALS